MAASQPARGNDRLKHLKIEERFVPKTNRRDIRNICTVQSALIRGDERTSLEGEQYLPERLQRRILFPQVQGSHCTPFVAEYRQYNDQVKAIKQPDETQWLKDNIGNGNRWKGFRLKFLRTLGQGGFGLVTLWNVDFEDGALTRVVIKSTHGGPRAFDSIKEYKWHKKYKGASHVVQPVNLNALARRHSENARTNPAIKLSPIPGSDFRPDKLNVLLLEPARYGNLQDMLVKLAHRKTLLTTKMLWEIWECLVRGVASVAYQPALKAKGLDFDTIMMEAEHAEGYSGMQPLYETPISHDVHFDLEPSNILADAHGSHNHHPIFKLHDFGVHSRDMNEGWRNYGEEWYWGLRSVVKVDCPLPEQVTAEWDGISTSDEVGPGPFQGEDLTDHTKSQTAGRYGIWSNIFHIGRVMESIMTYFHRVHPFQAIPYVGRTGNTDYDSKTYARSLFAPQFDGIDPELKDQVMQCMFHIPAHRPNIFRLLQVTMNRRRRGFKETDAETDARWNAFFRDLPAPDPAQFETTGQPGGEAGGGAGDGSGGPGPGPGDDGSGGGDNDEKDKKRSADNGDGRGNTKRVRGTYTDLIYDSDDYETDDDDVGGIRRADGRRRVRGTFNVYESYFGMDWGKSKVASSLPIDPALTQHAPSPAARPALPGAQVQLPLRPSASASVKNPSHAGLQSGSVVQLPFRPSASASVVNPESSGVKKQTGCNRLVPGRPAPVPVKNMRWAAMMDGRKVIKDRRQKQALLYHSHNP